jgi:CBS-domain-containing membrane protein
MNFYWESKINLIHKFHWVPPPKWPQNKRWMLFVDAFNATMAMGILGVLAFVFNEPMIFPSLGATAYLLFAHPHEHQAQFKNALAGHLIGAGVGWIAFKVIVVGFSREHTISTLEILKPQSDLSMEMMWFYVAAAAISIGLTLAIMVGTKTEHSPACSTTLIFSLGIFQHLWQVGVLMAGVLLLLLSGYILNWLAGFSPLSETPVGNTKNASSNDLPPMKGHHKVDP